MARLTELALYDGCQMGLMNERGTFAGICFVAFGLAGDGDDGYSS